MNILRDLKKTYDSKYSDIIKYIDENIIKIEEKDGKIIVRTSFEQIKSSLKENISFTGNGFTKRALYNVAGFNLSNIIKD